MVDIRPIGEPLDRLRARFSAVNLSARALEAADSRARAIAERYAEIIRGHIEDQDLEWVPLSERYLQFKIDNNLDPRTWIATGELMNAITVWRGRTTVSTFGTRTGWLAGLRRETRRTTGESMFIIARALEFGVTRAVTRELPDGTIGEVVAEVIPPRPLFLPSARQAIEEARTAFG